MISGTDDLFPDKVNDDDNITEDSVSSSSSSTLTEVDQNVRLPAKTLDGRLLCASTVAYEIRQPFFGAVGFEPHTQVKKITKGINSVLVGKLMSPLQTENETGPMSPDSIVVAFRGTNSALDWVQNVAANLRNVPTSILPTGGAKIHSGFYQAAQSLLGPLKEVLGEQLRSLLGARPTNPTKPKLFLTGHSKGGSLATVMALFLHQDASFMTNIDSIYVCTFGQARVGNANFAQYYNSLSNLYHVAYENDLDLVPFLPPTSRNGTTVSPLNEENEYEMMWKDVVTDHYDPYDSRSTSSRSSSSSSSSSWEYQPVGQRKYINRQGQIETGLTSERDRQRIRAMESLTVLRFETFRKAHSLSLDLCGSPGMTGDDAGNYVSNLVPELCDYYSGSSSQSAISSLAAASLN